jgi:hypothetical protein
MYVVYMWKYCVHEGENLFDMLIVLHMLRPSEYGKVVLEVLFVYIYVCI